ncbi:hypothetical protein BJY14_000507 [Actinomadura luteofluorescens]|uniref:Uncharacterized protein n=2 Tax=Actinomadura luteofluorescens TaxID=46163 RepID=A0A7Y9EB50_9ACTN|nr:hypothetical protein [Actinomadura luteofluorescens]NYD44524.1 hypothetical protein [Actinomadura luteofluorescens]
MRVFTMALAGAAAASSLAFTAVETVQLTSQGYGALRIGSSERAALRTGMLVRKFSGRWCDGFDLKGHPTGRDDLSVYISKKYGVAMIQPPRRTRTPRGVHVGSTLSGVKRAYPGVRRDVHGFWGVTAPRDHRASYQFEVERGHVTMMALNLKDQDCFN